MKQLADAIVNGDEDAAKTSAQKLMDSGMDPMETIMKGVCEGLNIVGKKYEAKEYFYPDLICGADAAIVAMNVIRPHIKKGATEFKGTFVIGTVEGDLHDIGKGLVAAMLEANGFSVIDLGVNVPAAEFAEAVKKYNANLVGASATLSGGVKMEQKKIQEELIAATIRDKIGYIIGGVVADGEWAKNIGADAYGKDCVEAVKISLELMQKLREA
ncbi:MAG: B12-binding domain-containing protein [Candidatus Bathyarchaeia archaeon]